MNCRLSYQLYWRRLVLLCLWKQAIFSPKKWLLSTGKEKQLDLEEGQLLKVTN